MEVRVVILAKGDEIDQAYDLMGDLQCLSELSDVGAYVEVIEDCREESE